MIFLGLIWVLDYFFNALIGNLPCRVFSQALFSCIHCILIQALNSRSQSVVYPIGWGCLVGFFYLLI